MISTLTASPLCCLIMMSSFFRLRQGRFGPHRKYDPREPHFGRPILIDPKGDDYSRYKDATVITPNRNELAQVVGKWNSEADLFNRAQNLRKELNLEKILLTRSEEGMTLFDDDGAWTVPAHAREVYDVSGAVIRSFPYSV